MAPKTSQKKTPLSGTLTGWNSKHNTAPNVAMWLIKGAHCFPTPKPHPTLITLVGGLHGDWFHWLLIRGSIPIEIPFCRKEEQQQMEPVVASFNSEGPSLSTDNTREQTSTARIKMITPVASIGLGRTIAPDGSIGHRSPRKLELIQRERQEVVMKYHKQCNEKPVALCARERNVW